MSEVRTWLPAGVSGPRPRFLPPNQDTTGAGREDTGRCLTREQSGISSLRLSLATNLHRTECRHKTLHYHSDLHVWLEGDARQRPHSDMNGRKVTGNRHKTVFKKFGRNVSFDSLDVRPPKRAVNLGVTRSPAVNIGVKPSHSRGRVRLSSLSKSDVRGQLRSPAERITGSPEKLQ
ncbi:hypothetical protein DPEC_G00277250 [Dallia pectoralis]|uniref:Uncharacterized protein n=1 Tax=Dallia pectoralis TaxID=75939 RepID=A0ACC2FM58_DALPE|nr:hypothetical protein DPEC_G00277250 [Dallia pectoralis]